MSPGCRDLTRRLLVTSGTGPVTRSALDGAGGKPPVVEAMASQPTQAHAQRRCVSEGRRLAQFTKPEGDRALVETRRQLIERLEEHRLFVTDVGWLDAAFACPPKSHQGRFSASVNAREVTTTGWTDVGRRRSP